MHINNLIKTLQMTKLLKAPKKTGKAPAQRKATKKENDKHDEMISAVRDQEIKEMEVVQEPVPKKFIVTEENVQRVHNLLMAGNEGIKEGIISYELAYKTLAQLVSVSIEIEK